MKYLLVLILIFLQSISFGQTKIESLNIDWPNDWKIIVKSEDSTNRQSITQLISIEEDIKKWSTIGNVMVLKNYKGPNLETVLNIFLNGHKKESSKAKITILEKNDTAKHFWVLYKVETSDFPNDPIPESQITYLIQGDTSLFMAFVIIKEKALSDDFILKWSKILKESRLTF